MLKSLTPFVLALVMGLGLSAGERKPVKPVNPNTASVTELMQLPGVGAKTAERIVAYRKEHGPFHRLEDLMNVKGIGEKSFAKLRPHLVEGGAPKATPVSKP